MKKYYKLKESEYENTSFDISKYKPYKNSDSTLFSRHSFELYFKRNNINGISIGSFVGSLINDKNEKIIVYTNEYNGDREKAQLWVMTQNKKIYLLDDSIHFSDIKNSIIEFYTNKNIQPLPEPSPKYSDLVKKMKNFNIHDLEMVIDDASSLSSLNCSDEIIQYIEEIINDKMVKILPIHGGRDVSFPDGIQKSKSSNYPYVSYGQIDGQNFKVLMKEPIEFDFSY